MVVGQSNHLHPPYIEDDRDWDEIGIVGKKDIIKFANHGKADLCKLLSIETELPVFDLSSHMGLSPADPQH